MLRLLPLIFSFSLILMLSSHAVAAPDLIVVGIKTIPTNPNPGDNVKFIMTVENIGSAIPAGKLVRGAFYVNNIKSSWTLGNGNASTLPQYGYRDVVADGGPYNGNSPYYKWSKYQQTVTAVVNDVNDVGEVNTTNNSYTKVFAPSKPDLIIVGIKTNPANPIPGQNVTFTMTVQNIGGDLPAGKAPRGTFYVNNIKTTWTLGNGNSSALPQFGYRDLIADGGPYGTNLYRWAPQQTVTAVVSDINEIGEVNTGNNSYTQTFGAQKLFYGLNGHYDYPLSFADTLKILKNMGVTNYRINTGTTQATMNRARDWAAYLIANGISVLPVLDCSIMGNVGDEEGSFAAAYKLAVQMVLTFKGLGIKVYEVGNEIDRHPSLFINPYAGGNQSGDYNSYAMPGYRGTIRGLIEGVHAAQAGALAGINFVGADTAAADMLWYGMQPSPTDRLGYVSGFKTARWDVTMWHNYEINLSIFNIGVDGGGQSNPALSIPEWAKRYNNNPFWLTEFGPNHEDSNDQKVTYMNNTLPELYNNRKNANINAIFVYQLDGQYGLMVDDKAVPITFYPYFYTYVNFIKTHPE